jgi:TonB family protein
MTVTLRNFFANMVWPAAILSLAIQANAANACSYIVPDTITPVDMSGRCADALSNRKKFLAKVKAGQIQEWDLNQYTIAFDEGKYGCRKSRAFAFSMLESYYSQPERHFTSPGLLERYVKNWLENYRPNERAYTHNLLWLFSGDERYLPKNWTAEQTRTFIEQPEHWKIALPKFGVAVDRDDAVFASISDPKSRNYDRDAAIKLSEFPSVNRLRRTVSAASLFLDPQFGPIDPAKAEKLLPLSAIYSDENSDPVLQTAKALWVQVADEYSKSSDPSIRKNGAELHALISPPAQKLWLDIAHPDDGRIWLSLANWPKHIDNPFKSSLIRPHLIGPYDYPVRARREEREGTVTVAAQFGTDGKYTSITVIGSSGSTVLDEAAVRHISNRFRPKLGEMSVNGYEGKEVIVPLLMVRWVMPKSANDKMEMSHYRNGILTVLAIMPDDRTETSPCGFSPKVFI